MAGQRPSSATASPARDRYPNPPSWPLSYPPEGDPPLLHRVVLACLLVFSIAGIAWAHAELVESDPADGRTITTPATLTARFSEELDPDRSRIVVRGAAGAEVARGGVGDEAAVMIVDLPELPVGEYVARWTAVTPDDQGVTRGTISFRVDVLTHTPLPPTDPPALASPTDELATPAPTPTSAPVTPQPSPRPDGDLPTAGITDVLIALLLAGAAIGLLALRLLRRR